VPGKGSAKSIEALLDEYIGSEIEEYLKLREEKMTFIEIPPEAEIMEIKDLYKPWARAVIIRDPTTGALKYIVDEIPLTQLERRVVKRLIDMLYWQMEPPPSGVDVRDYVEAEVKRLIALYGLKRLGRRVKWSKILYYILRDTVGYGPLDPLMRDPDIEDISCVGPGRPIYVWVRPYEYVPTNVIFYDPEELDDFIVKLAHKAGKHVSVASPIVDAILPGGHRLAATFRKEVSVAGSTFTIRKFREEPLTIIDLIRWGTLSPELAAYLWLVIENKLTALILGVTGAGKTSLLNALATLLRPTTKVVTIEDTPELKLPLENWVQLVSRPSHGIGPYKVGEITLFDLVKLSLRYRPDVIIVGEVRGEEAYVLFQAMATGHGGMTTMHAEDISAAVKRLTSPPMNIPESYIPLASLAMVIRRVRLPGAEIVARRVAKVWEIRGPNDFFTVAEWKPAIDAFEIRVEDSQLLKSIAEMLGKDTVWIFDEIAKRTTVLTWMAVKKITRYRDVAKHVQKYYAKPDLMYRTALEELKQLREAEA